MPLVILDRDGVLNEDSDDYIKSLDEWRPYAQAIEAIARQAGVSKQTIYRWWPSKGAVILEAATESLGAVVAIPDTGDIVAVPADDAGEVVTIPKEEVK